MSEVKAYKIVYRAGDSLVPAAPMYVQQNINYLPRCWVRVPYAWGPDICFRTLEVALSEWWPWYRTNVFCQVWEAEIIPWGRQIETTWWISPEGEKQEHKIVDFLINKKNVKDVILARSVRLLDRVDSGSGRDWGR